MIAWLELEKRREPFEAVEFEVDHEVRVAGMRIKTRADRVDMLRDGRRIILDYKTGKITTGCWEGDRPEQPQAPLYAVNLGEPVAAVAFAHVKTGKLGFHGLPDDKRMLPEFKPMKGLKRVAFATQLDKWRSVLEALGRDFCLGHAAVDPSKGACEYCGLEPLCRVSEASLEARDED